MLRVRPFRAWRYARAESDITRVTAPPYDVISRQQRRRLLAGDSHNVVALELPEGPADTAQPGNRYENACETWDQWRHAGVLRQDPRPCFYVLEQSYSVDGQPRTRRALIGAVGLEPFDRGIILPHERTLPKALGDRFELIRATRANFSQVLGLFDDPTGTVTDQLSCVATGEPAQTATDTDGVRSSVWLVSEPRLVEELAASLESSRVFIADGHHRYTVALAYRDECRARAQENVAPFGAEHDFVMMALVALDDPGLVVLPTHRVADSEGPFDADGFWSALGECFVLGDLDARDTAGALAAQRRPSFVVRTRDADRPRLVTLRDDLDPAGLIGLDRSDAWKRLDVSVLQELILWPLLGIHPDEPQTLERLRFVKDAEEALRQADEHDVVFVLRPTTLEQMQSVALGGETMPQKSTYFYPKLLSGLVLRSLD